MESNNILFHGPRLSDVFDAQHKALREKIDGFASNYIFNVDENDLVRSLVDQFSLDTPKLNIDARTIDSSEEVRQTRDEFGDAYDARFNIYTVMIPFDGEAVIFTFRPNSYDYNPPRGIVEGGDLKMTFVQRLHDAAQLKAEIEDATRQVEKYLRWSDEMIKPFNEQLETVTRQYLQYRKQKLGKDISVLAEIGIPVRKRNTIPSTVVVPVQRKPIFPQPKIGSKPAPPDPALLEAAYTNILKTMADMALVIERNPTAFKNLSEEEIRFHFLVSLNAMYEGNATAETFSYQGKTDIQIRHDGKPIFTAECKFWTGPKGLAETVNQLLSYVTWRDTKAAILIFNKNKNFTQVLNQIEPTIRSHPKFVRFEGNKSETEYRFVVSHPNDVDRHVTLAVLAFDIP
jgi:hypothetical protein